eukprot:3019258-Alexandrium_andersonii.AAC.1
MGPRLTLTPSFRTRLLRPISFLAEGLFGSVRVEACEPRKDSNVQHMYNLQTPQTGAPRTIR